MFTKTLLFGVARSAPQRLTGKARRLLAITSQRVTRRGSAAAGLVFVSAASGVPPFLGVSLAAGAVGMRTRAFVLSGGAGRLLRFGALAWIARNGGQRAMDALIAWGRLAGAGVQP
jgi:membrane protein YqaA with SNARE-associated domain